MATELDRRCPICLDSMDDASHVMPCLHQFCFGCIRRWVETRPKCPLCKRRVRSILHSVRADDSFEEFVVGRRVRARRAPQHQMQAAPIRVPIFRLHPPVLRPLLPWLRRELRQLFGADGRAAFLTHHLVISGLCLFGLDKGALTLWLSSSLQSQATSFVWRLIAQAAPPCCHGAGGQPRSCPPQHKFPTPAHGPPAAPGKPAWWSFLSPQPLPTGRVPDSPHPSQLRCCRPKQQPGRSWRRPCQVPQLPAPSGSTHTGHLSKPQREGPTPRRPLHRQEATPPATLGHLLSSWREEGRACSWGTASPPAL
ncbi:E3 ubiquitin-protein ligase Topors-like [Numida meleagris]|uniref:E3 ubiquitin-protein ligase Topors-like n=1 Tax=Numida meleagris TaxID=8996 RepID=UPI000B3DA85B|nr:E3 ubiquitin-protein ligase Topors-like [Numida meleagris]